MLGSIWKAFTGQTDYRVKPTQVNTQAGQMAIQQQATRASQQARAGQASMAASARGPSSALAMREAGRRGALASQDIGAAAASQQNQMAQQAQIANQQAAMQAQQANAGIEMSNAQGLQKGIGVAAGAIGGAMMSDVRAKEDITPAAPMYSDFVMKESAEPTFEEIYNARYGVQSAPRPGLPRPSPYLTGEDARTSAELAAMGNAQASAIRSDDAKLGAELDVMGNAKAAEIRGPQQNMEMPAGRTPVGVRPINDPYAPMPQASALPGEESPLRPDPARLVAIERRNQSYNPPRPSLAQAAAERATIEGMRNPSAEYQPQEVNERAVQMATREGRNPLGREEVARHLRDRREANMERDIDMMARASDEGPSAVSALGITPDQARVAASMRDASSGQAVAAQGSPAYGGPSWQQKGAPEVPALSGSQRVGSALKEIGSGLSGGGSMPSDARAKEAAYTAGQRSILEQADAGARDMVMGRPMATLGKAKPSSAKQFDVGYKRVNKMADATDRTADEERLTQDRRAGAQRNLERSRKYAEGRGVDPAAVGFRPRPRSAASYGITPEDRAAVARLQMPTPAPTNTQGGRFVVTPEDIAAVPTHTSVGDIVDSAAGIPRRRDRLMSSDFRSKEMSADQSRSALAPIDPVNYRYKPDASMRMAAEQGSTPQERAMVYADKRTPRSGIIAQQLQQSDAFAPSVVNTPAGLAVDRDRALSTNLAATAGQAKVNAEQDEELRALKTLVRRSLMREAAAA